MDCVSGELMNEKHSRGKEENTGEEYEKILWSVLQKILYQFYSDAVWWYQSCPVESIQR